jgi:hypothetical protein
MTIITKRYHILGLEVTLSSDSRTFLQAFDMDYALFAGSGGRGSSGNARNAGSLAVTLLERAGEDTVLSINGVSRSLGGSPHPPLHAYQMVLAALMREIRGFTIIHGGVVAKEGHALVISGPAGSGKTTLVTALLDRGCEFLSDDFCPIHEETRLVHPYPRTMWRTREDRASTSDRDRGEDPGALTRAGKIAVRLNALKVPIAAQPCRVKSLVYIDPEGHADGWCTTMVELAGKGEDTLRRAAEGVKGVALEKVHKGFPCWQIRYRKGEGHAPGVTGILKAIEPYALNVYRVDFHKPDFAKESMLTRVSVHEMARLLLKELKSEPPGLRIKPGQYFMKLLKLLEGVSCWRLTPGNLGLMGSLAASTLVQNLTGGHLWSTNTPHPAAP